MHAETVWNLLERTAEHPAHAYLFSGDDRARKREIAERFAALLLSETSPSPSFVRRGQTEPFSPYEGETQRGLDAHPDFYRLDREEGKKDLTVEQVRKMIERMQMTSARGGFKVAMIAQADRLNDQSANALLKAVEEPAPKNVYLFLTERPERLPATLRSRFVQFTLDRPASDRQIADDRATRLLDVLGRASLGRQIAELEMIAKSLEADEDADVRWRDFLTDLMRGLDTLYAAEPETALRIGRGLCLAWKLSGTSLSPRLGLEWAAVQPYLKGDRPYPSFLTSSFV